MGIVSIASQIVISVSVLIVWVFRFDNIVSEFKGYQISDLVRNLVGASKISLATLLMVAIWYPELATLPSLLMAFLMLSAQVVHFKAQSPFVKRIPSFLLLLLCLLVAYLHSWA